MCFDVVTPLLKLRVLHSEMTSATAQAGFYTYQAFYINVIVPLIGLCVHQSNFATAPWKCEFYIQVTGVQAIRFQHSYFRAIAQAVHFCSALTWLRQN